VVRPRKRRIIQQEPTPAVYKPAGVPLGGLLRVRLLQEEREALRLADLEGLTQAEAAERMGVSRSTFQRIISHGRHQVAQALCGGHALQVEGGTFHVVPRPRGPRHRHPQRRGQG
jgi:excisionase family DNA binding protein